MAKVQGQLSKLLVSTDDGVTYLNVGQRLDASLSLSKAEIDASNMDSGEWEEYMEGRGSATIDFNAHYDEDDAGQAALIDSFFGSANKLSFKFMFKEEAGQNEYTADGFLTSLNPSAADNAIAEISGTIRLNSVTKAEQVTLP